MQNYTCNSCGLAFPTPEDQRSHMKTDWHRYNLKRRVAQLPAIDEETFNSKIAAVIKAEEAVDQDAPMSKKDLRRQQKEDLAEKKRALLETARRQMSKLTVDEIRAKKQSREAAEASTDSEVAAEKIPETAETEEQEPEPTPEELEEKLMEEKLANRVEIPLNSCLFCLKTFPYLGVCMTHMLKAHGLYIPEPDYLVDVEGLISYLGEKIGLGNVCLSCNFQGRSLESVRAHMISKSHCKIPYHSEDEKLEISEFYDFTSSYGKVTTGDNEEETSDWEDVEEGSGSSSDDEEEVPQEVIYNNGYELHLPTGKVAGHRSMLKYYRQTFRPEKVLSEGQGTLVAAEARHFATVADRQQLQLQKRVWKREYKAKDSYDRHAARTRNHQAHYRDQLLQ
ncbi:unnamed protein product [Kuraishia capsulata CBS 1993]|uniref:C2H2-type domain-containing protein n=1 Tax=Kuraishia capsulata CBS 1993 TaxID=1382522 RepID=W6MPD3_9ASCO|nr:uncharacterized protein KUCA_T00004517001 [Kuraishia capsulata CBS 1993]CDK28534.1 unnamed protein product [Kuraishia capsulata CBS 1993]